MLCKASHASAEIGWLAYAYCIIGETTPITITTAISVITEIVRVLFIEITIVWNYLRMILKFENVTDWLLFLKIFHNYFRYAIANWLPATNNNRVPVRMISVIIIINLEWN